MALDDIVKINISRETTSVSRTGFGIAQFLGLHKVFSELARRYTGTTAMIQDGFTASDPEVQAASAYFGQTRFGSPDAIVIGRRESNTSAMTFKAMTTTGQIQGVTINGTAFEFTSATGSETAAVVMAAVLALVNGGSEPVTATDLSTGGTFATDTMSLTSDVTGAGDTIVVSTDTTAAVTPTLAHIPANTLAFNDSTAIQVVDDDWYGLAFHDNRRAFTRATMSSIAITEVGGLAINGTDFEFTAVGAEDAVNVATNVADLINAGSEPVTAINNFDGTIDIVDTLASNAQATVADSSGNTNANSFAVVDPVVALATSMESIKKLFGTSSGDTTFINVAEASDTLSNAKRLSDATLARTYYGPYDTEASTAFPELAWMGQMFPTDPGSATWKFKTLATITPEVLTETQKTNGLNKNGNIYTERGGVNITCNGTVAEGEFIDIIRGVDWLDARMTERIYQLLVNLPKIPYTNDGVATIENEIRAQLDEAIEAGLIANDPANHDGKPYTIIVPLVEDVSPLDKADRLLQNVKFRATLAGAIHKVIIDGVVTV